MPNSFAAIPEPRPVPVYASAGLRVIALIISIVLHPLLISAYVMAFLMYIHPGVFVGMDPKTRMYRLLSTLLFTVLFPAVTLLLARQLKLIKSIGGMDRQDRIIGYLVAMFFYWWTWNVFRNLPDTPPVIAQFTLGTFLTVCGGWFFNIFFRVSMHAMALGGLCTFSLLFARQDPFASGMYIAIPVLATGLGLSARLLLGAHRNAELIAGLLVGMVAQWIASLF